MKKVFRTFIITILLVVVVGIVYIVQEKPSFAQEIVGCSPLTDDQKDFNNQLADAINDLRANDEKIMDALESITTTKESTTETNDNTNTENITTNDANNQLDDATQAADDTEIN